jgi:L-arabonate dehydrase
MEEFYYAGGLPGVIRRLGEGMLPHPNALTVNGKTMWDNCQDAPIYDDEVIRTLDNPIRKDGGICILRGNLAPRGAVLKPSAATPELMQHRGKAVVFEDFEHYKARINDPDLDVDGLRAGDEELRPERLSGHGRSGQHGPAAEAAGAGVKDMVRISDARMSGTAYGTVVLHVAPEAMAGGPLGIVKDGDWITLDCAGGKLDLEHRTKKSPRARRRARQRAGAEDRLPAAVHRTRAAGRRRLRLRLPGRQTRFGRATPLALIHTSSPRRRDP